MKKRCSKCKRILDYSKFYKNKAHNDGQCSQCKECMSKYQKKRCADLKLEAINAFGGQCVYMENGVQCYKNSKNDLQDLELSHPNGDGNEHRALISNGYGGYKFYRALQKLDWNTGKFVVEIRCKTHHHSFDNSGKKHPQYKEGKFNDSVWLKKKYENMTIQKIANLCGVSDSLIRRRMVKFGHLRRKPGQHP